MNSILVRPIPVKPTSAGRLLAIEPDAQRAAVLREILRDHAQVDLKIVKRTEDAIRSISEQVPDLVMTSTFLPPAEEAALAAHVKQVPGASHVQVINVPYFIDGEKLPAPESSYSNVLSFLRRRPAIIRPRCDVATLREQIEEYLRQAIANRSERNDQPADPVLVPAETTSGIWLTPVAVGAGATGAPGGDACAEGGHPSDRRRAQRRRGEELPSLWTIRLPWGSDVKVVDISKRGALLESASRITTGSTVDLQLLGENTNLFVPARMLRAEVAGVDTFGVKYRIAAAFSRELDLVGLEPAVSPAPTPRTLVDLLTRVLDDVERPAGPSALRVRFESELRRLLRVRDIQIRETPMIAEQGAESIYFTVPWSGRSPRILQAVFEPGYAPSAMEFRLLRAAASVAAVVLEFASLSEESSALVSRPGF